jgi:hypothetical protein
MCLAQGFNRQHFGYRAHRRMYIGSRRPNNIVLTQVNTLPTFSIACAAAIRRPE